ncbi:hypothetical protein A1O3_03642 [Capronia epimyces CBS 606.96]|uniref:CHAT domain-containing protein n=1 Tax=Capronia epimyces CBS 606.96 TaxID=1182542 RepID=W9YWM8_9EURO|nr:uncharacterized protein A1O3_03642 [Capronia epimyces CBS 606.96]EXJ86689.1 hypothetical protein A1O3_03642 [Capronia epimyces CBS 606.96]
MAQAQAQAQPSPNLLEARRLGDLGFYRDAAELYAVVEAEQPISPLNLLLEVSGFNIEQGLIGVVVDRLNSRTGQIDRSQEKPLELALFDLLWASVEVSSTVRLADPLAKAIGVFNEHLRDRAVEDYDKQTAYLAVIYHGFCRVVGLVGFMKDDPPPVLTPERFREIFHHLQEGGQHKVAFKLAVCYGALPESFEGSHLTLLDTLIQSDLDSDVLRADIFLEYAEALEAQDKAEDASMYLELAEHLYVRAGHAYGPLYIQIKRLRKGGEPGERQQRIESLFRIKSELENLANWHGVRQALQALHQINLETPDDSLSTSLNVELLKVRGICRNDLDWVSQRMIIVRRWCHTYANIAQSLQALEELYDDMKDMDAPIMLADLVMLLYDAYTKIGDAKRANLWLSQQRHLLPRSFMILFDLEPFFQRLQAKTSLPEPERERRELEQELNTTRRIVSTTKGLDDRAIEVRRVANVARTYMAQYSFRSLNQITVLVNMCLQFVNDCSAMLSIRDGKDLTAVALQVQATLKIIEANQPTESKPGQVRFLLESSQLEHEALQLYLDIDKWISASLAKAQMANCLQTVWLHQGASPDSTYFHEAVQLYVEAVGLATKVHHVTTVRLQTMNLLRLWFKGFQHRINIDVPPPRRRRSHVPTPTPLQMVEQYLEKMEDLTNVQRNDLSALKNERSILAKQDLRRQKDSQDLYDMAVRVFATVDDNAPLWTWVQKAKARGVSDLLALGINLPGALTAEIEADPALSRLVEEERRKQSEIESAPPDHQFYLAKELAMHRSKMREHPPLGRMLDLREGCPVGIQSLRGLQQVALPAPPPPPSSSQLQQQPPAAQQGKRYQESSTTATVTPETVTKKNRLIFVDWFKFEEIYGLLVVTEDTIHAIATGFTIEAARNWKEKYLRHDLGQSQSQSESQSQSDPFDSPDMTQSQSHPLDSPDMTPLQELSALIEPLLSLSDEGDILVFCPTEFLHGIPIHAATLDATSRKSIIERNPIVYTSSMTTLSHCVSRELQRGGHCNLNSNPTSATISSGAGRRTSGSGELGGENPTVETPPSPPPPSLSHSFVTVFEETAGSNPVDDSWKAHQAEIYSNTREIGSKFPESTVSLGHHVTPQVLRNAFEFDMMYFFGHCRDQFDNVLDQALVLAAEAGAEADAEAHPPHQEEVDALTLAALSTLEITSQERAGQNQQQHQHHFTVRDIFRSKVQASNVMLIACGSASESCTPGDEPLGIITSLLCAGASSVIGTLWKVKVEQGMDFSGRIYDMLLSEAKAVAGSKSDNNSHNDHNNEDDNNYNNKELFINLAIILQKTICKMKRKKDFCRPFQWAPYILSGSWFVRRR